MRMLKNLWAYSPALWTIALASIFVPMLITSRYYQDIAVMTFLWAGLAGSWNLYSGYSRRISAGHAAFLGLGAYTSTLLYLNFDISPWLGMLAGGVVSGIAALVIGGATLRLKGTFFTLSTIAFNRILEVAAITATSLTAGSLGLFLPHRPGFANMIFDSRIPWAVITWAYMLLVVAACVGIERSKLGYCLIALGENQEAAENLGVNSTRTMLTAFVISAVLPSFGGTLLAGYVAFIEPTSVMGVLNSVQFILLSIAGGMGIAFGPMVGSFILTPVSILLRGNFAGVSGLHGFVLGMILVLILLFRPDGILPQFGLFFVWLKNKKSRPSGKGGAV